MKRRFATAAVKPPFPRGVLAFLGFVGMGVCKLVPIVPVVVGFVVTNVVSPATTLGGKSSRTVLCDSSLDSQDSIPFFLRRNDQEDDDDDNNNDDDDVNDDIRYANVGEDLVVRASDFASTVTQGIRNIDWDKVKQNVDTFAASDEVQTLQKVTGKFVGDALSSVLGKSTNVGGTPDSLEQQQKAVDAVQLLLQSRNGKNTTTSSSVQDDEEIAEILRVAQEAAALVGDKPQPADEVVSSDTSETTASTITTAVASATTGDEDSLATSSLDSANNINKATTADDNVNADEDSLRQTLTGKDETRPSDE